jgi:hypothetical protein
VRAMNRRKGFIRGAAVVGIKSFAGIVSAFRRYCGLVTARAAALLNSVGVGRGLAKADDTVARLIALAVGTIADDSISRTNSISDPSRPRRPFSLLNSSLL